MDLLSARKGKCAIVAQDSPSSEDLDDYIVMFGQQNSEKQNYEKIHYEICLNKIVVQKKKCHTTIQEVLQMNLHILQTTRRKGFLQRTEHVAQRRRKNSFWGEPNEKYQSQILIMKESEEDDFWAQLM